MKKILYAALALFVAACGTARSVKDVELERLPEGKILVVYFSESPNKNTQTVAAWIHEAVGGDIQGIEAVNPYSGSYRQILNRAREEFRNNIHPEIKPFEKNVADYDIIFIGSPIWFNTYAPPVATFLANNSFEGKIVVPFCTHGGGGAGNFYDDIRKNAIGASEVKPGFTARGSNQIERRIGRGTKNKISKNDVAVWLNEVFDAF
ncbi:MAG: NAD(P)H-dependent oxidoreductase [Endomicrobia bacterium]|nr:NAD(P)H-dependent oxidoreductase [Endomicrobiia bacterium]